ncbi:uncharacterized protein M421DRAFT_342104 [Didymella exigua CBS 183.55]|uniref:Uncharacterized protein n=1 Tax=Didymella exigua CBS 183.55 TaxID=1150837 RepID=A0A6A5RVN0_9PLEO|nr:uncharacterized protein M421DRAFT_342104 [Didymella exigua CBS 183.55]KAF1931214.1 hypothetical protein M421DRAFT_342104 [Didymella exigua CBS 183.55]
MAISEVVQGAGVPLCAAAVRQARLGVGACKNRLSSAPRSGTGSGEQSAAKEARGCRWALQHAETPLPAHALIVCVSPLSSGCNTINKRAEKRLNAVFVFAVCILHPRAQRSGAKTKHARLPQREPGPGSTAPGTSSPTPVLRPSPSPHGRLHCSLSPFLHLRIATFVTRCLSWIVFSGSVGRRRFLLLALVY